MPVKMTTTNIAKNKNIYFLTWIDKQPNWHVIQVGAIGALLLFE